VLYANFTWFEMNRQIQKKKRKKKEDKQMQRQITYEGHCSQNHSQLHSNKKKQMKNDNFINHIFA